ncbi:MAG: hypothetical protein HY751_06140 [Nitrospinae bacterium]|nr:hypothetical protein [Nitrospinota bacterium]
MLPVESEKKTTGIYYSRDTLKLQESLKEAKVLGFAGAKTDMIQRLTLTAQPSRNQLTIQKQVKMGAAKEEAGFGFTPATAKAAAKTETKPEPKPEPQTRIANVYKATSGFASVA